MTRVAKQRQDKENERRAEAKEMLAEVADDTTADAFVPDGVEGELGDEGGQGMEGENSTTTPLELTTQDLERVAQISDEPLPSELIAGQSWSKISDVLPPCPPRGMFDVERIRDSAYFFS